ncbi:hypothetical protein ES703_117575 [subsurface metagenome]
MAEKSEKKKKSTSKRGRIKGTLECVGTVCFNPDTNKIEIVLDRGSCPPKSVKGIVESLITGAEVEVVLPALKDSKKVED